MLLNEHNKPWKEGDGLRTGVLSKKAMLHIITKVRELNGPPGIDFMLEASLVCEKVGHIPKPIWTDDNGNTDDYYCTRCGAGGV